jgi:hypothetical protein
MRRLVLLGAAVGALLGTVSPTGALAAGPGPGKPSSPPGQEQIPPGQAKKADDAQPAPPGQQTVPPGQADQGAPAQASESPKPDHAGRDQAQGEPATPKPMAHEKNAPQSHEPRHAPKPAKPSSTHGNSTVAHTHVIICHRTGSTSNPYVVINISMSAWLHGHSTHPELNGHRDIVLKQGAKPGEKMPRSACGVPGVITPTDPTRPKPPRKPEDPRSDPPSGPVTPQPSGSTSPGSTAGDAPGSHDGEGAAVAAEVAETAGASELPFTGMPLWVAILAGFWLIGSGLAIRKAFGRPAEELSQSSDQFTW